MKTLSIILFLLVATLAGCSQSRDSVIRKQLPGDWHADMSGGGKTTFTFAKDGGFESHVVFQDSQQMDLVGTYYVKDGFLVQIVTNFQTPMIVRSKIIEADEHKMIVLKEGSERTFEKDTK